MSADLKKEMKKTYDKVKIHDLINFNYQKKPVKVSVIVPIYNNENYLNECIDSIINQTLEEIEIICVNDGSTDNSLKILKEYADKDYRVKIIDKDNSGYGHVMNIGMDLASGEYIGIVESDDYILPEMYEKLYETAKEFDLDFVKSDFYRFYGEGDSLITNYEKIARDDENYDKIISPKEFKESFKFIMNTWNAIYSSEFLRKNLIRHNETPGASFQDNGFWFKANIYADKTMYLHDAFYMNRRDNPNSSVHNPEKVYCSNEEYQYIYNFLEENDFKEEFLDVYTYKKFHNYMFTIRRIAPEFRREYLNSISQEFNEQNERDELKTKFLSPNDCNTLNWIMRDPEEYYYEILMKKVKVSVILPVYNMELYISECLDSLLNQSLKDIEIICINDGSTDNTLEILQNYQQKDHRIKIINQENKGAGYARNIGIKYAEGEYLSFLDSDDFFDKDMLKLSYEKSKKTNSDICIYGATLFDNQTGIKEICTYNVRKNSLPKKEVFNRNDIQSNIFKSIMGWAWDKLYKKTFVLNNNLQFQEQRTTNDMYFVFASLLKAGRITILDKELYFQRRNVSSSLSNSRELSWDCFYKALLKVKEELIKMEIYEEYERNFVNYALHSCLWNLNSLNEPYAKKLFKKLKISWFDNLSINGHDESYFDNKTEYNQYLDIINIPHYDTVGYDSYKINYWKNKYSNEMKGSIMNMPIKIREGETLTVNQMKEKLVWNRKQRSSLEAENRRLYRELNSDKLKKENWELKKVNEELKKENHTLINSNSWKITEPLRKLKRILKHEKN